MIRDRRYISFIIEGKVAELLKAKAHSLDVSVSELCRRIIIDYLVREQPPEQQQQLQQQLQPQQQLSKLGALDGGGEAAAAAVLRETASERRWRLMVKLDEPELESLINETKKLESKVEDLEKDWMRKPEWGRRDVDLLSRQRYLLESVAELKKLARRLIRDGYEIPEEVIDKLGEI